MIPIHRSVQTETSKRRRFDIFRVKFKALLSWTSSLIVPLIFGLFTILLTIEQNRTNREQSIEDRKESSEQRREQWLIAKEERENQWKLSTQRYRDDVLISYIKDIGDVLEKNNGQLSRSSIVYKVVRAKTLNAFRQLDGFRSSHIIRFLYETGQLSTTEHSAPLDVSSGDLFNLSRNVFQTDMLIGPLHLVGVILQDSSFNSVFITRVNLSSATFQRVNFSEAKIHNVDFVETKMIEVEFSSNSFSEYFEECRIKGKFEDPATILEGVDFSSSYLKNTDFVSTILTWVQFSSSKLDRIEFSAARFNCVDFSSVNFFNVDFSSSQLVLVDFSYSNMENVDFSGAEIRDVCFDSAELFNVNFDGAILENVTFKNVSIRETSFNDAVLENVLFHSSVLIQCKFFRSQRISAEFNDCQLRDVEFFHSNAEGIRFVKSFMDFVNFDLSNLRDAIFDETVINENDLINVVSIENVRLGTGTPKSDNSLLFDDLWEIDEESIKKVPNSFGTYRFSLCENKVFASMSQSIDLNQIWDRDSWPVSFVEIQVNVTFGVSIQILGWSNENQIVAERNLQVFSSNFSREKIIFRLENSMFRLSIKITMNRTATKELDEIYVDEISLKLDYGTRYEPQEETFYIPKNSRWNKTGEIFAGSHGRGDACHQLSFPSMITYDQSDDIFYISDYGNHRVLGWKSKETQGRVVAGLGREGLGLDRLNHPLGLAVQRERVSIVICDFGNNRVVRWSLKFGTRHGSVLIEQIQCYALAIDRRGYIYISDVKHHRVIKFDPNTRIQTIVAGGNDPGSALNQLNTPKGIAIDDKGQIFIADKNNSRIVKWMENSKEGVVIVKGNHQKKNEMQLDKPIWLVIDADGFIYVSELHSNRITRWHKELNAAEIPLSILDERQINSKVLSISSFTFDKNLAIYTTESVSSMVIRYDLEKRVSD